MHAAYVFAAFVFHVKRLQQVVASAAETQHQEALDISAVLAGGVYGHLIDSRLINLHLAIAVEDVLLGRILDVGHHLQVLRRPPEVHFPLLCVGFLDHALKLFPHKVGLRSAKFGGGFVHPIQNLFQSGAGLGFGRGLCEQSAGRCQHECEANQD